MNYSPGTKYIHYYTGEIPEMVKFVFKSIPIANFADLSSGDGSLLYSLNTKGYFSRIKNIIAVDISQERMNNVRKVNDRIKCCKCDICNLKMIKNNSLDFVVSNQVIEHISGLNFHLHILQH